ncbi:hypothetical protein V8C37DRAFT_410127 [Trichoderma ceciliae]
MPHTPRLAPLEVIQTTASEESPIPTVPKSPSPISLFENASPQIKPRSLPVPPERSPALGNIANFDPNSIFLPPPRPVFLPEFASHWGDGSPQIRPLPQTRVPPRMGPPSQTGAIPPHSPLRSIPGGPPFQTRSIPTPPPFRPIRHPNPLRSLPPRGPPVSLEHISQLEEPIPMQGIPLAGDVVPGGMLLGPDALRQPEQFPRLQTQPRRNVPQDQQQNPWDLPGHEIDPSVRNDRPITGHWMGGEFILLHVGGKTFRVPIRLLAKYPFWASLTFLEQPPQGWSMPAVDPDIFTVLIECVYSTSGLHGTEPGLNLVKICFAITLAWKWGMSQERRKLRDTAYRYIVRKVLNFNPLIPGERGALDQNYYVYRSEELYRTWELTQQYHVLQKVLCQGDLIALYASVIPQDIWPALTANFKHEFAMLIDVSAAVRTNPAEVSFRNWWLRFFRLAGYLEANWLSAEAADRLFGSIHEDEEGNTIPVQNRAEFEAARARGNALMAAFEARQEQEPPTGPTTPADVEEADIYGASPRRSPLTRRRGNRSGNRVRFSHPPEIITPPHQGSQSQMSVLSVAPHANGGTEVQGDVAPAA